MPSLQRGWLCHCPQADVAERVRLAILLWLVMGRRRAATATFAPCPSGGAFSLDFTLTGASPTSIDVSDQETWTIVSPCTGTTIDAATVPAATCATRRTLHYALVQSCATPCTIIETNLVPSCTCPQGSAAATSSP
jgi:hypothetical protein